MEYFKVWIESTERITVGKGTKYPRSDDPTIKTFEYQVHKNPTRQQLLDLLVVANEIESYIYGNSPVNGEVRGLLSCDGDIYIWPSTVSDHEDMGDTLRYKFPTQKYESFNRVVFYIAANELKPRSWMGPEALKTLEENANFRRMMGENPEGTDTDWRYSGMTWKQAIRKARKRKVEPGTLEELPVEWLNTTMKTFKVWLEEKEGKNVKETIKQLLGLDDEGMEMPLSSFAPNQILDKIKKLGMWNSLPAQIQNDLSTVIQKQVGTVGNLVDAIVRGQEGGVDTPSVLPPQENI